MRKILFLFITIAISIQAQADINLPPSLLGYWESDEVGLFIFKEGMRFTEIAGAPTSILGLENEVIVIDTFKKRKNTLYISFLQAERPNSSQIAIKVSDDLHISLKYQGSPWLGFEKKERNLTSYSTLFDYKHSLDPKLYSPSLDQLGKYERLSSMPERLKGFWMSDWMSNKFYTLIFEHEIISGYGKTLIDEIYKNGSLYIIIGKKEISGEEVILFYKILEDKVLTQSFTGNYLINWAHKKDPNLLTELRQEHQSKSGNINLNELFFNKYYLPGASKLATDFTSAFQVKKDATVNILGEEFRMVRAVSMIWGKGAVDNGTLGLMLELNGIDSKEKQNVQVNLNSKGIEFIVFGNGSVQLFKSFDSLLEHLIFQILTVLASVAVSIFIFYRLIVLPRKLKQRLTTVQLEGIKSQLNPHFLFNSMASIQSLLNQEKHIEANRYLSDLSDLLRYHLDAGSEDMVLLSEELSALQHYLELENLRSPFHFSFEIDTSINPDLVEIHNQLLQPLVENAVKHGLRFSDEPRLLIRVQKKTKSLCIYIKDNGPGIFAASHINEKLPTLRKTHKGLALIKEKISILKKKGVKCTLKIDDLRKDLQERGSGTQVSLELPLAF